MRHLSLCATRRAPLSFSLIPFATARHFALLLCCAALALCLARPAQAAEITFDFESGASESGPTVQQTKGGSTLVVSGSSSSVVLNNYSSIPLLFGNSAASMNPDNKLTLLLSSGQLFKISTIDVNQDTGIPGIPIKIQGYDKAGNASGSYASPIVSGDATGLGVNLTGVKRLEITPANPGDSMFLAVDNVKITPVSVITYNGNGNTGGSPPSDNTFYDSATTVTAKANTGALVKTGYTFAGWNTQADGGGTTYAAGSGTFTTTQDVTLYAKWTSNPPYATTGAPSSITANTATLAGTVRDNGLATTVVFQYGTSTGYGSSVNASPATVSAGAGNTSVSGSVTGLTCNTMYHYRVVATSTAGTTNGSDGSFTTAACTVPDAPTIGSVSAGAGQVSVAFTAPANTGGSAITGYTVTSSPGNITGTGASSPITVTGLTNGTPYTFTVTATNSVGTGAASSASASATPKGSQTITFANPGGQTFGTSPSLSASSSSGLTVSFTSTTTGVCTVSGTTLSFVSGGTCTINADQAGNSAYAAATTVPQSFNVAATVPGAPTIGAVTAGNAQATVAFTPPASNGGSAITSYTAISSPGGFTASGASSPLIVTGLSNGQAYTFTVKATNGVGAGAASAASSSATPAQPQTITFVNPGAQSFGTTPALTATSSSSLSVSFTSSTTSVCTITTGGALTFLSVGTCTIDADQAGNGVYLPAATVTRSFSVNAVVPGAPTIGSVTAGNTQATVAFSAPAFTGGSSITGYTVTSSPGAFTATGASSPISVSGLTNGTAYTFTVKASNTVGSSVASAASSSVTPSAAPPVAGAVSATVAYGSSSNVITPSLSGGSAASLAIASSPAHGSASVSGLTLIYTPTAAYSGSDSFTYTATNGGGTSAAATVSITVTSQTPTAGAVSMSVLFNSQNNQVPLAITGGAATSVSVASAPSHGVATVSGTRISYTPATGYSGADSFTYTATNNGGSSTAATISITVQARLDPSKDTRVTGIISNQNTAAKQFATTQVSNFQTHLEHLHSVSGMDSSTTATGIQGSSGSASGGTRRGSGSLATFAAPATQRAEAEQLASRVASVSSGPSLGNASNAVRADASQGSVNNAATAAVNAIGGSVSGESGGANPLLAVLQKTLQSGNGPVTLNLSNNALSLPGADFEIWTEGSINIGRSGDTDSRFTTTGVSMGTDFKVTDGLVLGIGAGFGRSWQKVGDDGTKSSGTTYVGTAYGSYRPIKRVFLDAALGYGLLSFHAQRYVTDSGATAQNDRDGSFWFASTTLGYEFGDKPLLISPYTRLDVMRTRLDKSTETGAASYNIAYDEQYITMKKGTLGLRGEMEYAFETVTLTPYLRIEYQHDFQDSGTVQLAYADTPGTTYTMNMDQLQRDAKLLGLGSKLLFKPDLSLDLQYKLTQASGSTRIQGVTLRLAKSF